MISRLAIADRECVWQTYARRSVSRERSHAIRIANIATYADRKLFGIKSASKLKCSEKVWKKKLAKYERPSKPQMMAENFKLHQISSKMMLEK